MENIVFIIIMELCSIFFYVLGYLLWKKEKISIMHSYHYTKVKETDKKAYTSIMGKAVIVMGIGMSISGIVGFFIDSAKSGIPFAITFIVGIIMMGYGQIKYNHGIF
ncbi:MAG: DUF3784 domain-containing protein [Lachnospiraceae bacterium]|nr:DUF3784 domain-containing protein [Lachnospiraceae bacterium]